MEKIRQVSMKVCVYTVQGMSGSPSCGKGGGLVGMDSFYNTFMQTRPVFFSSVDEDRSQCMETSEWTNEWMVNGEGDALDLKGVFIHQVILASRTGFWCTKRLLLSRSGEFPHQGQNSWCGKLNFYKPQLHKHRGENVNSESSKNAYPRWNQGLAWELDFKFCNAFRIHHPLFTMNHLQVIRFRSRDFRRLFWPGSLFWMSWVMCESIPTQPRRADCWQREGAQYAEWKGVFKVISRNHLMHKKSNLDCVEANSGMVTTSIVEVINE